MKLLEMIKAGEYTIGREPDGYNGFGQRHRGATVYNFGNGVSLRTYTNDSFFLYVDNSIQSLSDVGLSDEMITAAFVEGRKRKLSSFLS